jgi:hypothetical protein
MQKLQEKYSAKMTLERLGKYLSATPRGRKRVIQELNRKSNLIEPDFSEAKNAIARYIAYGDGNEEVIYAEIERLEKKLAMSELQKEQINLSIDSLESFLDVADEVVIKDYEFLREDPSIPTTLLIAGTTIDVSPEIILRKMDLETGSFVGAVKIYFSKNYPLSDNAGKYMATLLYQYLEAHFADVGKADYSNCFVIDVFNQKVYRTPRYNKIYRADIHAACEEIARAWAFIIRPNRV